MDKAVAELVPVDIRWPGAWDSIKPYLEEALDRGSARFWDIQNVYDIAIEGHIRCWGIILEGRVIGAGVTVEKLFPKAKALDILLFGMDKHTEQYWLPIHYKFRDMARAWGYQMLSGEGRPGWAKKLEARQHYSFEIDL
jgi:hypothetical protein